MSFSLLRISIIATAAFVGVAPVLAQEDAAKTKAMGGVIATVNGRAISKRRADTMIATQVAAEPNEGLRESIREDLRKSVREELINHEVLFREAQKLGLSKRPEIIEQLDMARQGALISAYKNDYGRSHPINEEALRKEYKISTYPDTPVGSVPTYVAIVNNTAISKSRANEFLSGLVAQGQTNTEELRKAIREQLIRREILSQEAQKLGYDKNPEIIDLMDFAGENILIKAYMGDYLRNHPISDEALRKEYGTVLSSLGNKEYKARHILVDNENDAKAIIDKLKRGERFEDLARRSKDSGSNEIGGDLGWGVASQYVEPFANALARLQKGEYTATPVKSMFGYHVILLEDSRDLKVPAFSEIKQEMSKNLQKQNLEKHIAVLRAKAKID